MDEPLLLLRRLPLAAAHRPAGGSHVGPAVRGVLRSWALHPAATGAVRQHLRPQPDESPHARAAPATGLVDEGARAPLEGGPPRQRLRPLLPFRPDDVEPDLPHRAHPRALL